MYNESMSAWVDLHSLIVCVSMSYCIFITGLNAIVDKGQVTRIHSKKSPNVATRIVGICGAPHICSVSMSSVKPQEGMLYYDFVNHS